MCTSDEQAGSVTGITAGNECAGCRAVLCKDTRVECGRYGPGGQTTDEECCIGQDCGPGERCGVFHCCKTGPEYVSLCVCLCASLSLCVCVCPVLCHACGVRARRRTRGQTTDEECCISQDSGAGERCGVFHCCETRPEYVCVCVRACVRVPRAVQKRACGVWALRRTPNHGRGVLHRQACGPGERCGVFHCLSLIHI